MGKALNLFPKTDQIISAGFIFYLHAKFNNRRPSLENFTLVNIIENNTINAFRE